MTKLKMSDIPPEPLPRPQASSEKKSVQESKVEDVVPPKPLPRPVSKEDKAGTDSAVEDVPPPLPPRDSATPAPSVPQAAHQSTSGGITAEALQRAKGTLKNTQAQKESNEIKGSNNGDHSDMMEKLKQTMNFRRAAIEDDDDGYDADGEWGD